MSAVDLLLGVLIAGVIIVGTVLFAIFTPNLKGLSRHNITGHGDSAAGGSAGNNRFDDGGDSGGGD